MNVLWTDYLLAVYVVMGMVVAILLGYGLGAEDTIRARRAARRDRKAARRAVRARAEATARAALADAQRDDALAQLARTEDALALATRPVAHAGADPFDLAEDTDALLRVVMDRVEAPAGAHHRPEPQPCLSLISDPFAPESPEMYCEHESGQDHTGRHTAYDGAAEWDDGGDMWIHGVQQ